jgi:DnaD/phage-associated family protein
LTSNDGTPNCYPSSFPLDGCWQQETLHRVHQGIYQKQPSRLEAEESGRTICDLCQEGVNKMAKYRQIHVNFWQDSFVLDLTPEEKYFYLYLMTNSKTSQCGIYELPKKVIEMETGYNRETVDKLLQRFIDYGKIKYNEATKEIFILNWAKYNMINSSKVMACIKKELEQVKTPEFVMEFISRCQKLGYKTDTISIPYPYGIDTVSIDYGEEKEQEEEKEEEKNNVVVVVENACQIYQQYYGTPSPNVMQSILYWINHLNDELVTEAIKRAVQKGKSWDYAVGILREWHQHGLRTLTDIEAYEEQWRKKKEEVNDREVHKHRRGVSRSAKEGGKSYEQILREAEAARKAWGG